MPKLTQEQIDALPTPPFTPARDMMLCQREVKTPHGIHLPDESADKVQTCRVLTVGQGLLLDDGTLKQSRYQRGDRLFITPTDGYPITLDGRTFWLVEQNEVMGELTDEDVMAFGRDVC